MDPTRTDAAERLLEKLRGFATELDDEERALLAVLLGPGVDEAWSDDEVVGFDHGWRPAQLPEHLARAIRERDLRIEGL